MVGAGVAGGLDGDAALLGEREERLGGLLGDQGQVDGLAGEGPLVGAAEQEQRLGEVDRAGVDGVEAVDELAGVAVRVVAGDVEQRLGDRQRGAQLVGGVGGEPLLLGDVRLEPREHGVEGVGELAELVLAALQLDPVGERPVRGQAGGVVMRVSGASMRPARIHPPRRPNTSRNASIEGRLRDEGVQQVGAVGSEHPGADAPVGHVAQQEHPHDREQQTPATIRNPA